MKETDNKYSAALSVHSETRDNSRPSRACSENKYGQNSVDQSVEKRLFMSKIRNKNNGLACVQIFH